MRTDVRGVGDAGVDDEQISALNESEAVVRAENAIVGFLQGGEHIEDDLNVLQRVARNEFLGIRCRCEHYEIFTELRNGTLPTFCGQVWKR